MFRLSKRKLIAVEVGTMNKAFFKVEKDDQMCALTWRLQHMTHPFTRSKEVIQNVNVYFDRSEFFDHTSPSHDEHARSVRDRQKSALAILPTTVRTVSAPPLPGTRLLKM